MSTLPNREVLERELSRHFTSESEEFQCAMGIFTGTLTTNCYGVGKVELELTDEERAEHLAAIIKSQRSWFGFSIAHYMSPELEALVCGNKPERYRVIEPCR